LKACGNEGSYNDGYNTEEFIRTLNQSQFGGYSDWRMPTREELRSIVNYELYRPAIDDDFFSNAMSRLYWSSITNEDNASNARGVDFDYGSDSHYKKSSADYVRAVRSGQYETFDNLIIREDGTVKDQSTGLIWQQETIDPMSWKDALLYCQNLSLGGFHDGCSHFRTTQIC